MAGIPSKGEPYPDAAPELDDSWKDSSGRGGRPGGTARRIGPLFVPPPLAQQQSKQPQQQIKRDLKAQQKAEEPAQKCQELLELVQPLADRFAEAMLTRQYFGPLVQGYLGTPGQSLVPSETPASTTFSFRVVQDIVPNADALPGRQDLHCDRHAGARRQRGPVGDGAGPPDRPFD